MGEVGILDGSGHTATGPGWDTGELARGASASIVFAEPGRHPDICTIHPSMEGTVIVAP